MTRIGIKFLAQRWLKEDRWPGTRQEIQNLLNKEDFSELERRLRNRIAFGTAGLRGRMQAGYAYMNALTVIQASLGLADYLIQQDVANKQKGVVIGFDARHNSNLFARLAAAAFLHKDIRVCWLHQQCHTPLVPFTVRLLEAAAGVMITASHNPAYDNGYKVYWSNGSQIIPPHDVRIAQCIEANTESGDFAWDESAVDKSSDGKVTRPLVKAREVYNKALHQLISPGFDMLATVYTPMHGVGLEYLTDALKFVQAYNDKETVWHVVPEQAQPDPDFPTVKFPNPEEKGALDLAQKYAETIATDGSFPLIIANDPDADRFTMSENVDGHWYQFTGNQLGVLFADFLLSKYSPEARRDVAMLCSTVSSSMLKHMAEREGFIFRETLTGFKWLGNVAQNMQQDSHGTLSVPFAYEEAIGYMFSAVGFDKDGIAAALVMLKAVAEWKASEQLTPYGKLMQLYQKYGYFAEANTYLISPSPAITADVFDAVRELRGQSSAYPTHLGTHSIMRWRDLTVPHQYDSATSTHEPDLPVSADQMITCIIEGGARFTVRASGTEPKIKLYVEGRGSTAADAQATADEVRDAIIREWLRPEKWGLRGAA